MKFAGEKDVGKTVHIVSMTAGEYTDMPQGVRDRMKNTNDMWTYPTEQTIVPSPAPAGDEATAAKAKIAADGSVAAEVKKENPEDAAISAKAAFVQVAPMNDEMVVL